LEGLDTVQDVHFIVSLSTAAVMGCLGICGRSVRKSCRARRTR